MNKKNNLHMLILSLGVALFISIAPARAIMLEAIPSQTNVASGETFSVDLVISGLEELPLDEVVRAYHIELAFDPGVITVNSVAFGNFLGLEHTLASLFQGFDLSIPGVVILEEVSLFGDDALALAQPDSFVLASIDFGVIAPGISSFEFLPYLDFGIDIKGRGAQILPLEAVGAVVGSVAEPETMVLMSIGLVLLVFQIKRKSD